MDERRTLRVSEAVREELIELVGFEMEDPRLIPVEISDVDVSQDGRHATVRVAMRAGEREQKEAMAALEHAKTFIRHELSSRLSLRHTPELHFERDRNPDVDSRIDFLLKRARRKRGDK
jgi:ribosome-binding factor A